MHITIKKYRKIVWKYVLSTFMLYIEFLRIYFQKMKILNK
jgi:hypothetical protein